MDEADRQVLDWLSRLSRGSVGWFDAGKDEPESKGERKNFSEWIQLEGFIEASPSLGLDVQVASKLLRGINSDKPDSELTCDGTRWGIELTELCDGSVRARNRKVRSSEQETGGPRSIWPDGLCHRVWTASELRLEIKSRVLEKDQKWRDYGRYPVHALVISSSEVDPTTAHEVMSVLSPFPTTFIDRAFLVLDYFPDEGHPAWEIPVKRRPT